MQEQCCQVRFLSSGDEFVRSHLHCAPIALHRVGVPASQLNLLSLTSSSGAGCGPLQLLVVNWAISLLKY